MMSAMLICIGGFPGSGAHFLAEELSRALGFYYFPLSELKRDPLIIREHRLNPKRAPGFSDELLLRLYRQATSHFRLKSKLYPDTIIRDEFTREIPREVFFKEAEKYFGPPLVIWVDSSEEEEAPFLKMVLKAKPEILNIKLWLQRDARARFEPFTRPIHSLRYLNNPAALDEALTLVREHRR